jgi:hypothetical protein
MGANQGNQMDIYIGRRQGKRKGIILGEEGCEEVDFDSEVEWEELRECWCILGESERPLLDGAAFIWMLGVFSSQLSQGRKWIKFLDELFYRSSNFKAI